MTTLRDEIAADQGKPTQCAVCRWLDTLDPKSAADWRDVLADRSFTHASIHRAMARRDSGVGRSSVETHRSGAHK